MDYPQAFSDGKRVLAGTNIIDCGLYPLADQACTPEPVHIHPLRWSTTVDGSGPGGSIHELRLNPDDTHLGFSSMSVTGGRLDQYSYMGRLQFNPSPETGRHWYLAMTWSRSAGWTGRVHATKKTSPDGFHLDITVGTNKFQATGTLTTTVDDHAYTQPANGT
ncbi:hypothetical protein [Streptomyces bluensis]|uniref:hypothetical protein n=1 Tax=Streptomyces bluensis TaxID=33897 RepID=UPI00332BD4F6